MKPPVFKGSLVFTVLSEEHFVKSKIVSSPHFEKLIGTKKMLLTTDKFAEFRFDNSKINDSI